jgi:hypothetical protein
MAVSANTLFHFTGIDNLKSILSSQYFYPQYSEEHFEAILPPKSNFRIALIPLISFCDLTIIQLSRDSVHTLNFGGYGIGLTKTWGIRMKISPVIYVHKNSQPSNQLYKLIRLFRKYSKDSVHQEPIITARKELLDSFKFIKPYQGKWQKNKLISEENDDIIYYNEREWRYCPPLSDFKVLSGVKPASRKLKEGLNSKLKYNQVRFKPNEIKFIVLKRNSEIDEFVTIINNMSIDQKQKNELITRIITFEEINEDY